MRTFVLLLFLSAFHSYGFTQGDSLKTVEYDTDFKFTDGIFITFDQAKKNLPVLKSRIISTTEYSNPDFFDIVLSKNEIAYYDNLGMKQTFPVNKIWGFSKNGNIYVRMYDSFNRLTYIGSICHYIATITTTYQPMYDPYYYNPYYYNSSWNNSNSTSKTEIRQFIIEFESGKILDYDEKNLEAFLIRDPIVYDEYMGLSKRKKKQMKFYYIRKFNERNPLKIPVYSNTEN